MSVKTAASKVKGIGDKVGGVIYPLGVALPVAAPNVNALMTGGPRGLLNFNVAAIKSWRPPDWGTIEAYADGPGGSAVMTAIVAGLAKWAGKTLFGEERALSPAWMLVDAVEDWGIGSAGGWAIKELVYPTVSGEAATFGDVGWGTQPAKGSPQEMRTKDQKPKARLTWS